MFAYVFKFVAVYSPMAYAVDYLNGKISPVLIVMIGVVVTLPLMAILVMWERRQEHVKYKSIMRE